MPPSTVSVDYAALPRPTRKAYLFLTALLGTVFAGNWYLLPTLQAWFMPTAPGGTAGPWVLRPIVADRVVSAAGMTMVGAPLLFGLLVWFARSGDDTPRPTFDPLRGQFGMRAGVVITVALAMLVFIAVLFSYLFSSTAIGPEGIVERGFWATHRHAFQDIQSLENIPTGMRSDSVVHEGPWYRIKTRGGRTIVLSLDNEGLTPEELKAIADFIAKSTGSGWKKLQDARVP